MLMVIDSKYCSYYGYNAMGERLYKITGVNSNDQLNGGYGVAKIDFDEATLYSFQYLTIKPQYYTKHYFIGNEHIATTFGNGGFEKVTQNTERKPETVHESQLMYWFYNMQWDDPYVFLTNTIGETTKNIGYQGLEQSDLQYKCAPTIVADMYASWRPRLHNVIGDNLGVLNRKQESYFYHNDHLGSTKLVMDGYGHICNEIDYMPFGETFHPDRGYLEKHKFTGKERDEETQYNYAEGNPELTQEFNNQVDLNFSYSQYVSLAFNFSHTQDMFSQRTEILPNGDGRMKWKNFGTCTTHGGNLSLTELPLVPKFVTGEDGSRTMQGAWLALTLNGGYYYFINRSYDGTYVNRSHWGYGSANLNAYLSKDWTLSLDGFYNAPMVSGYTRQSAFYSMNFGVRKMWREKGLIFNLQVQDLMRSMRGSSESLGLAEGNRSYTASDYRNQKVIFSLTWMFGQQQYVKHRNVGNLDESSRLGSGGGVGQ